VSGAAVVGVGLTTFGKFIDTPLHVLAGDAISLALADAGIEASDIDMAFVANAMASLTTGQVSVVGQSILRPNGFAELPVYNIDNACAGSSSALELAVHAIEAGRAQAVLVVGVEKLFHSDKTMSFRALNGAVDTPFLDAAGFDPGSGSVFVSRIYPERLARYVGRHPLKAETLAAISVKNRRHAALNPRAQYTKPLTMDDVLQARTIVGPITALMCAPISDGASAAVVMSGERARARGGRTVWIRGIAVGMGAPPGGGSIIARVARRAYREADIEPGQIDVAEVHDSISFNELLAYEELGLCAEGAGADVVANGTTSLGGLIPVNTSGGLESRGHPVAATGLAQIAELVTQLRGEAGDRQVGDARIAVAENAGGFAVDDTAATAITILCSDPA
jgi:acetyl-CoA acyltransferase